MLILGGAVGLFLYGLVLFAHGFLPGLVNDAPTTYLLQGSIRCLHDLGPTGLTSWCHDFGEPLGHPELTGGPVVALGALAMYLPGVGSYGAYLLAGAAIDLVALAGSYGLLRRLGACRAVAAGTAAAYLLSPTVLGLEGFGGTFFGFALLPAYAWVDLIVIDGLERRRGLPLAGVLAAYAAVKTSALFMDGYSFVAATLVSGALWFAWVLRSRAVRQRAVGVGVYVGATAVALATYALYVPGSYERNPLEVFRGMGLDLATVVAPTVWVWPAAKLGLARDHSDLWGDGTNTAFNYAGIVCVGLAVMYLARRAPRREAVALAAAGMVAFVLALGPSLKINERRPEPAANTTVAAYLMPEHVAAADFPWSGSYTAVPGLDAMRASYRWYGVTRMALIVLAGLAVARLVQASSRRWWLGVLVGAIAVVEILPNLPLYHDLHERNHRSVEELRTTLAADFQATTDSGERVFLLGDDAFHNDYLANYLAAGANVRAYNTGGDKNAILSQARWPPQVSALAKPAPSHDEVAAALASGKVDVVVAPYFNLRLAAYSWPPSPATRTQARAVYAALLEDPRFDVQRRPWFATIRLSHARR